MRPWLGSTRAELVRAYVQPGDEDDGAGESLVAMTFLAPPEEQWAFIEELVDAAPEDEMVFARIAAGPIEGLLARWGEIAIAWVEQRAARDPRFRRMLEGVWQYTMSNPVWARVCAARRDPNAFRRE